MKSARGKPFRKTSLKSERDIRYLPFPVASISTILLVAVFLSFLSALYTGAHRTIHQHSNIRPKGSGPSIQSFQDLALSEIHPRAGPHRHIVSPPPDESPVTLVTCSTTAGYLHILVHESWAPLGAQRFLQMVESKYFSTKVALMRCIKNFLCQFGIAGDPSYNEPYIGKNNILKDDTNWLPEGPTHRKNELGVKRFGKGYLAYAGSGKNSRSNQLIISLNDNERLGGGSPWEVPWGEIVGGESFSTLDKIFTGYGEKGPSQGRLRREGSSDGVRKDFPNLDYILHCDVIESI
ncbi:hypothetical protein ACHAXR_002529 [Thalassiosira sp. AJA248-18]